MDGEDSHVSGRFGAWMGILGPAIFVATFSVEGWLRPDYPVRQMLVSALSLGPRGWVQVVNFLVVGVAFLAFAPALRARLSTGVASLAGPILLLVVGLALLGSGPFVMDAAGTTVHGHVHRLLGVAVCSFGPASAFVLFRRFRSDPGWRPMAAWTLLAAIAMTLTVVLFKVATLPPPVSPNLMTGFTGVIQRVGLVALMAWVASLGVWMLRRGVEPPGE
jgi:hypothetical protein